MNRYDNKTLSNKADGMILKTVVDAMLDSLTVEQQTKMASYLLRNARQHSAPHGNRETRRATATARVF